MIPASFMRLKSFMTESKMPALEKHEIMIPYDTTSFSIPLISMALQNIFASRTLQSADHVAPAVEHNVKALGLERELLLAGQQQVLCVLHVLVPAMCAQEAMELGDGKPETKARERTEHRDGDRDVACGSVVPGEKKHRGQRRERRAAHFVEQGAGGMEATMLGEDGEHGVVRAPTGSVALLYGSPRPTGTRYARRHSCYGGGPARQPRSEAADPRSRRVRVGPLGRRDDRIHVARDSWRELLEVREREAEKVILAVAAAATAVVNNVFDRRPTPWHAFKAYSHGPFPQEALQLFRRAGGTRLTSPAPSHLPSRPALAWGGHGLAPSSMGLSMFEFHVCVHTAVANVYVVCGSLVDAQTWNVVITGFAGWGVVAL
ncbi:hypothetical protein ABZP36_026222 [Zizania latifolia]